MNIDLKIQPTSINDLRDKYFDGLILSQDEESALNNFDKYRIQKLNSAESDADFKLFYLNIQAMANISSYLDFLSLKSF